MNCYVLVGGRSTRLGTSKAALFLDRVAAAARLVFERVIAVDRSCGADILVCETIYEEPHDDEAPIFGVRRALLDVAQWSGGDPAAGRCFILAVDYPLITSELLRAWSERFAASSSAMLVPRSGGHLHVLCAGYSHRLLPEIDARIARRQYDLRSMVGNADVIDHDGVELMNVNDREELERYEQQRLLASR